MYCFVRRYLGVIYRFFKRGYRRGYRIVRRYLGAIYRFFKRGYRQGYRIVRRYLGVIYRFFKRGYRQGYRIVRRYLGVIYRFFKRGYRIVCRYQGVAYRLAWEKKSNAIVKVLRMLSGSDRKLHNLLIKYEFKCTGVNIHSYIPQILLRLSVVEKNRIVRLHLKSHELEALQALGEALQNNGLSNTIRDRVDRLISVVQYAHSDLPLTEKREGRAHQFISTNVLYQAHMRAPIVKNGYVSRSKFIIDAIKAANYHVVGATRPGFPNELQAFRDAKIEYIECIDNTKFYALKDNGRNLINTPIDKFIEIYAERIVEIAKIEKIAIIHAASNYINGLASIIAARKIGVMSVYEVRGMWHITRESREPEYARTIKYALEERMELLAVNNADRVITISQGLKDYFTGKGVDAAKITVVPNGVNCNQFVPINKSMSLAGSLNVKGSDVVIGYVGSIVDYEGLDIVLRAVASLVRQNINNIKLLIVGGGAEEDPLKKLSKSLQIEDVCIFAGLVPKEEVNDYYSLIDIAPFVRKSLPVTKLVPPLKPMEAMAMGCSVVVSDLPALIDIGNKGESIFQCPSDDHKALADILIKLISSPDLRASMGEKAREWVLENRSLETLSKLIRKSYE